jgi:4-amino-4-deoxy-L-arabinose transferase-like glycosyltransferase
MTRKAAFWDENWLLILAAVLAAIVFVLPLTVRFPLLDPDEGLHASISQEMVECGDWMMPHFLGKPFFDKPILYFWCQALSLRVFGMNEAAVRLPGLMFGLLGAITTGLIGRRMFGRTAGWVAGIFYGTMILPVALTQAASHDVALIPCINLAILLLWEWDRAQSNRTLACYVAATGFLLGLIVLIKGLTGVGLVLVTYVSYAIITRRLSIKICCGVLAMLVIAALVASTWYIPVEIKHPGFLYYYLIERHFLGFATATQIHGEAPWWYYLPIIIGGGLPWISYLPVTIGDFFARRKLSTETVQKDQIRYENDVLPNYAGVKCPHPNPLPKGEGINGGAMALLFCWLIGCTVLLSVAHSKLVTYIWPVFPAVAVLAAVCWSELLDGALMEKARRSLLRTFFYSSLTGPIALPLALFVVHVVYGISFSWPVWIVSCLAGITPLIPLTFFNKQRWQAMLAASTLSTAVQFVIILTLVMPSVAETFTARELAEHFNRVGRIPVRLLVAEERLGSLVFYMDANLRSGLKENQLGILYYDKPTELPPGTIIALPEKRAFRVSRYAVLSGLPYKTMGRYRLYEIGDGGSVNLQLMDWRIK